MIKAIQIRNFGSAYNFRLSCVIMKLILLTLNNTIRKAYNTLKYGGNPFIPPSTRF